MLPVPVFTWRRWWEILWFLGMGLLLIIFYPFYFGMIRVRKLITKHQGSQEKSNENT